ncbi:hypothetical protein PTKIN_Ptkin18bG0081900 [Pterospermum kingtungense]
MGFLNKLWDDTLAGPMPETGLGKLRKYNSFSGSTRSSPATNVIDANHNNKATSITRSITILKSNTGFRNLSVEPGLTPGSPSGSSTPRTPLSPGTPGEDIRRFTRRKSSTEALDQSAPTVYDWIVMSALDR